MTKLNANKICIKNNILITITIYNNFDFAKHRFEKQLSERKTQYKIITILQFVDVCISNIKLQQNI